MLVSSNGLGAKAMGHETTHAGGSLTLSEIREFASFPSATQRYVRRSLDVAFERNDAIALWSRDRAEADAIRAQSRMYHRLPKLRMLVPDEVAISHIDPFMGPLVALTAFDLGQKRLPTFGAYRFLYERLIGAAARPWLPAAFCAAASMPHLEPERRRALLQSISEAAATAQGWSDREPIFYPEWVETVEA